MIEPTYRLAPQGVYNTVQGEGILTGIPMTFIRLAGCPVACGRCDTDYSPHSRLPLRKLVEKVCQHRHGGRQWVWLTGGEPTAQEIDPLITALQHVGLRVALATAGVRKTPWCGIAGPDFLSVSPHDPNTWVQREGDQLNLVPGLGGLDLAEMEPHIASAQRFFNHCWITPLADAQGNLLNLQKCLDWLEQPEHHGWRLGVQAHRVWGLD